MKLNRSSGILLHPTSLPGRFGIGDFGPECYRFLDFLQEAKQKIWQVLPLGPTGPENSPYQSESSVAGNPLLLSPEKLRDAGYLSRADLADPPTSSVSRINFLSVRRYKDRVFRRAFRGFSKTAEYKEFERRNSWWLEPYANFVALREANGGIPWNQFKAGVKASSRDVSFHKFLQYEFFRQWREIRLACVQRKIAIMGDMPFYIELDSADVWQSPQFFDLDGEGNPRTVGGVPPDYFSRDGQLWGNPTYRWGYLKRRGYSWWVQRFRAALEMLDILRVDHFRGFLEYWSVPFGERTARNGRWKKGPGLDLFRTIEEKLGPLSLVAENLGVITPAVEKLRTKLGLPGMVVLQFGFSADGTHRPNNYPREVVAFTGTHDNNTTAGWWGDLKRAARNRAAESERQELARVKAFLQTDGRDISWCFIQAVMASVADVAVIPLQDVLELGSRARMNVPGRAKGNWTWRFLPGALTTNTATRLRELSEATMRCG